VKRALISSLVLFFGCGDDTTPMTPDGPSADRPAIDAPMHDAPMIDAPVSDAPADAMEMADASPDATPLCPAPIRALTLPNDSYDGTLAGSSLNMSTSCQANTQGPENTFTLHLTQPTVVALTTAGGTTTIDTVIEVRADCDNAASALFCDDDSGGSLTSLMRAIMTPGDYFVLVDEYGTTPATGGPYTLTLNTFTPEANATCQAARALTNTTPLTNQSSVGGGPFASPCADGAQGGQVYYTLTIPASSRATITATPTGTPAWAPTVRVLSGCDAAATCMSAVTGADGVATVATTENTGSTPLNVVVAVAGNSTTTGGTFDLSVAFGMLPFDQTTIATSCDDVSTGTVVAGVATDDSASAITALPFNFTFFATTTGFYSVTSNGFLQLWTSTTGTPSTEFNNTAIPNTGDPNGFVAPFWDDLINVTGETTEVRSLVVGTTPNRHFTVQWTNWRAVGGATTRLTFQAKLFETTNIVEFHYCTLTAGTSGDRVTGNSATVGIESLDGTNGFEHSFNTPMSVSTANALRFTPR